MNKSKYVEEIQAIKASNELKEKILELRAQEYPLRRQQSGKLKQYRSLLVGVSCTILIITVISLAVKLIPGAGSGGSGSDGSGKYSFYTGPILPLTVLGDTSELVTDRKIDISIDAIDSTSVAAEKPTASIVDDYTLENTSGQNRTLKLYYPFISSLSRLGDLAPTIKIEGQPVEYTLVTGDYTGGFYPDGLNLKPAVSWQDYQYLDNGYLSEVLASLSDLDEDVHVMSFDLAEFTSEFQPGSELVMEFNINQDNSVVLAQGMSGMSYNSEGGRRYVLSPEFKYEDCMLVLIGDLPTTYTLKLYSDNDLGVESADLTTSVHVAEANLNDVLTAAVESFLNKQAIQAPTDLACQTAAIMLKKHVLGDKTVARYAETGFLEGIIDEAVELDRIMYASFEINLQAGQTIQISSSLQKLASYSFDTQYASQSSGVCAYDITPRLGSNLKFSEIWASLKLSENFFIVRQNMGFDLANGIDRVPLGDQIARYFLEIKANK